MIRTKISALLIALIALSGCSFLDVEPGYVVDAYLTTRVINGDTMVAINGNAQSNVAVKSVRMYNVDGKFEYDLKNLYSDGSGFEFFADTADYMTSFDDEGLVYFEITHENGDFGLQPDYLYSDLLLPFEIKEVVPDTLHYHSGQTETVLWDEMEDVAYLNLTMTLADTLIYFHPYVTYDNYCNINSLDNWWINNYTPQEGDTFKVYMSALMLEYGASSISEIQCVAYSPGFTFVWSAD